MRFHNISSLLYLTLDIPWCGSSNASLHYLAKYWCHKTPTTWNMYCD